MQFKSIIRLRKLSSLLQGRCTEERSGMATSYLQNFVARAVNSVRFEMCRFSWYSVNFGMEGCSGSTWLPSRARCLRYAHISCKRSEAMSVKHYLPLKTTWTEYWRQNSRDQNGRGLDAICRKFPQWRRPLCNAFSC